MQQKEEAFILDLFKRRLEDIATKAYSGKLDKAFISWFLDIKFPELPNLDKKITDGKDDGGIDAIVKDSKNKVFYIIQSKYTDAPFKKKHSKIPEGFVHEFDGTISHFKSENTSFSKYLSTVRSELRRSYEEIYRNMRSNPNNVIWILTTMYDQNKDAEARIVNLEEDQIKLNFHYMIDNIKYFGREMEGMKLAPGIELTYVSTPLEAKDPITGIKTYVAQVLIKDFIAYLNNHDPKAYIISANVRNLLKDSPINESIKETYEKAPDEFWYSHNGITVICDRAIRSGTKFNLKYPQVINGGQTLRTCAKSLEETNATVLVKILEISPELDIAKELKEKIILRNNQSNKIFAFDLKANDGIQVNLANKFQNYKIFYERRRGDWDDYRGDYPGYKKLSSVELAQILVSANNSLGGVHAAKSNKEKLFENELYEKIFNQPFNEILFKYKLFIMSRDTLRGLNLSSNRRRQINTFVYNCFSIIWNCVESYTNKKEYFNKLAQEPDIFSKERGLNKGLKKIIESTFMRVSNKFLTQEKKGVYITDFAKSPKWIKYMNETFAPKIKEHERKIFDKYLLS
jgi:hypothetical protein